MSKRRGFGRRRLPRKLIYLVGMYTIGAELYDMGYASVVHNSREELDFKERYGEGTWAVVSGASNNLGQEFSKQFQQRGFNVLMID